MSAAMLSTLLLVSPALPLVRPAPAGVGLPSLVEPESGAWAIVDGDALWVCWEPSSDCFVRIELELPEAGSELELDLELESDPALDTEVFADPGRAGHDDDLATDWRLGFWGPRSLWIARGDHRWRLDAGQRRALASDEPAPLRLVRIAPASCGPDGLAPAQVGGRWVWREVPRCKATAPTSVCVQPAGPRVRTPTPLRLRAGIELRRTHTWTSREDPESLPGLGWARRRLGGDVAVQFVVEIGFDPAGLAQRQALAQITRARTRARARSLPPIEAGPTAARERAAMASILCGGSQ